LRGGFGGRERTSRLYVTSFREKGTGRIGENQEKWVVAEWNGVVPGRRKDTGTRK